MNIRVKHPLLRLAIQFPHSVHLRFPGNASPLNFAVQKNKAMYLQKLFAASRPYIQQFISCPATKRFIRRTLTLGSFFSLSVYVWVRLIFHDVPFELLQEAGMILDLLFTGCCLVGLSIGGFNLLMFVADYYSAPVKSEPFAVAIRSVFTSVKQTPLPPEYNLFNSDAAFTIDKTGRLRYVVKMSTASKSKEDVCADKIEQGVN